MQRQKVFFARMAEARMRRRIPMCKRLFLFSTRQSGIAQCRDEPRAKLVTRRTVLRLAIGNPPALILLDLTMPVLNGWDTMERLSADPTTYNVPVMALTCVHLERERLEEAGFCGYLEKPLAPYRVFSEVERCIGSAGGAPPLRRPSASQTASASRHWD